MVTWKFDERVAANFDYIADTSIPKYRVIIHKTVNILKSVPRNSKIIDIGCATGNTLDVLKKNGFTNIWGVDNSHAMLEEAIAKGYNTFEDDLFPIQAAPFDAVIANWTLHFIQPEKRLEYMNDIWKSLNNGGMFILSEKVDEDQTEYLNFKRSNFLTEEEIKAKTEALKGVLVTKPIKWYEDFLSRFHSYKIIDHTYCFVTFLVIK